MDTKKMLITIDNIRSLINNYEQKIKEYQEIDNTVTYISNDGFLKDMPLNPKTSTEQKINGPFGYFLFYNNHLKIPGSVIADLINIRRQVLHDELKDLEATSTAALKVLS